MGTKVYAAIPALDEFESLPDLIEDLVNQQGIPWEAHICINQPDEWWKNTEKKSICNNNKATIEWLHSQKHPHLHLIDRSSPGNGWKGKKHGVGWARKTAMDAASDLAQPGDILVSMDADTRYPPGFFQSVVDAFKRHPGATGLSAPYFHPLTGDETTDRCILRYEIYMRNYDLNMLRINSPYAFTAIGSGMACRVSTYRQIGGMTPKMSGEDFYFMQKLRKAGNIIVDSSVYIRPASRYSDRVYFGTGPAMIKGREGNWDSYPIYHTDAFNQVERTYDMFGSLYKSDVDTPMDTFLTKLAGNTVIWNTLRSNSATGKSFIKACSQRVDALRILQFLKENNTAFVGNNEERLGSFIVAHLNPDEKIKNILGSLSFETSPVAEMHKIRCFMAGKESALQQSKGIV